MKITAFNIDDIIREEKRKEPRQPLSFYWGKDGYESLRAFVQANVPCIHGWFCLCMNGTEEYTDRHFKQGFTFMGVKHFWDRRKVGYTLTVNK